MNKRNYPLSQNNNLFFENKLTFLLSPYFSNSCENPDFFVLYIDEVILQRTGATDYYFTHDYRYSVTSLTNTAGNIVESYDYKVYGERTVSDDGLTDVGYTGQRHDSETGLMYFKNRYYSTSMGQFVTRDPLGYVDGLSMYLGYFGADGVDPFGNFNEEDSAFIDGKGDKKWDATERNTVRTAMRNANVRYIQILKQIRDVRATLPKDDCYYNMRIGLNDLEKMLKKVKEKLDSPTEKLHFYKEHRDYFSGDDVHANTTNTDIPWLTNRISLRNDSGWYFSPEYTKRDETMFHELLHLVDPFYTDSDKSVNQWISPTKVEDLSSKNLVDWDVYKAFKLEAERCYLKDVCKGLRRPEVDDYAEKFFKLPKKLQDRIRPPTPYFLDTKAFPLPVGKWEWGYR